MHELNICLNILKVLETKANQSPYHRITKLWLEIGELAGVELEALRFSFPIAAKKTPAEQAVLEIITIEGRAWCDICQINVTLHTYFDPCPKCGQYHYRVTQGKELRVVKMEVE